MIGFGPDHLIVVPTDDFSRAESSNLPVVDESTVLILQAGEVNTGQFRPFADIIPIAKAARAWVHIDGAFVLWARASKHRELTAGIDGRTAGPSTVTSDSTPLGLDDAHRP